MNTDHLRRARANANMTQAQVAELVGIEPNNYSRYETGKHSPTLEIFERLCVALKVSASYLLGLTSSPGDVYPQPEDKRLEPDEMELLEDYRLCSEAWRLNVLMSARAGAAEHDASSFRTQKNVPGGGSAR